MNYTDFFSNMRDKKIKAINDKWDNLIDSICHISEFDDALKGFRTKQKGYVISNIKFSNKNKCIEYANTKRKEEIENEKSNIYILDAINFFKNFDCEKYIQLNSIK